MHYQHQTDRTVQLEKIPPLPSLASRIIESCFDDHANYQEMAGLIKQDPILTARILALVNSPSLALPSQIKDLSHAISIIGRKQIRNLALSVSIFDTFSSKGKAREQEMVAFWRHCIACAHASEEIARELELPQPEEAFIAGLLHDIGKLIVYHQNPDSFRNFLDRLRETPRETREWPPLALEETVLNSGHHLIGKRAAENWNFPESISEAVWLHHQPPMGSRDQPPSLPVVVRLADALCNLHNLGSNYFINHELDYAVSSFYAHTVETLKVFLRLDQEFLLQVFHKTDHRLHEFDNCLETVDNELYFSTIHMVNRELGRLNLEREKTLTELYCKNRLLECLAALDKNIGPRPEAQTLVDEIVTQARILCASHFAFCGLSLDENTPCCWRGQWGMASFSDRDLAVDKRLIAERHDPRIPDERRSRRTRVLSTIRKLLLKKPEALLKNSRITPLKGHSTILVIPLVGETGPGFRSKIYGQLLVDCKQLGQSLINKNVLLEIISRFTSGISEIIEKVRLTDHLAGQAEKISELCRRSEELQFELLQAQRLATVGRLAAGAAHEINNPLAVISGQLQMLKAQAEKTDTDGNDIKRYDTMMRKVDIISRIVSDLLTYGRPQKPQIKPLRLADIVSQALDAVRHRRGFAGIKVELDLPEDLPAVRADPQQLGQILINLLINAELAMSEGGNLRISARPAHNNQVSIQVSDNGHGIAPDILPTIFDPFFTTREGQEGTGLGLSIVHSLVEANHGRINVSSTLNQGSTFTIFLPAETASATR